ncbi:MAG: hypothetical protein NT062_11595 [Proteobacteria bacterium]|nr:hypothetical protein [Pseudomonadota bacterium]
MLLLLTLVAGCDCNAKPPPRPAAAVVVDLPTTPKLGDLRPVPLDAAAATAVVIPDALPSPGEQAYLTRRTFFSRITHDAKVAATDCAKLAALVRSASTEARAAMALAGAVAPDRIEADRRGLDDVVKMLTLARCEDTADVTALLDDLTR